METSARKGAGQAPNLNVLWASLLLDELHRGGIRHVCISPGSRSGPLAVAAARHGGFRVWVHIDERSSGYFAVGVAKATGEPAVLISTSGTAAANFLPAVVEASLSRTALVVLTADRPPELRRSGAPQTIDQTRLFGEFARWFADLPVPEGSPNALRLLLSTAAHALSRARGSPRGPVHVNVPFREPLAPVEDDGAVAPAVEGLLRERAAGAEPHMQATRGSQPAPGQVEALERSARGRPRGVIVCGPGAGGPRLAGAVAAVSSATGYPVFADVASGARFSGAPVGAAYDLYLRAPVFASARPEITLEMGGVPVSKALQGFLDRPGIHRVRIQDHSERVDPFHGVKMTIQAAPAAVLEALAHRLAAGFRKDAAWQCLFESAEAIARRVAGEALAAGDAPREAAAVVGALSSVPSGGIAYLANSMPIRDADTFVWRRDGALSVYANRGASGIDGLVSSAVGAAAATTRPTLLAAGDLAVLHDVNGFHGVRRHGIPLVTLVINNDGGGIFSFLPISGFEDVFEPYFATPHGLGFQPVAALFGMEYTRADSPPDAARAVASAFSDGRAHLIEMTSDRSRNAEEHRTLAAKVVAALGREVQWRP